MKKSDMKKEYLKKMRSKEKKEGSKPMREKLEGMKVAVMGKKPEDVKKGLEKASSMVDEIMKARMAAADGGIAPSMKKKDYKEMDDAVSSYGEDCEPKEYSMEQKKRDLSKRRFKKK